jgi:antirestriction protein ArdC
MSNASIREQITNHIVEAHESGTTLPWRRPWSVSPHAGRPTSLSSRRPYSGVNAPLLQIHANRFGFTSKWWATFRQWQSLGLQVRKRPDDVAPGHWGANIVFYKPIVKTVKDDATGDERDDRFFLLRTFTVFNADQVEGAEASQITESSDNLPAPDFGPAEQLIESSGAEIRHGGEKAFYVRPTPVGTWPNNDDGDYIVMPHKGRFDPPGAYYETLFHELAHHSEVRLEWPSDNYALNELIAELSASFLSSELGVPQAESLDNHAAYVQSWLSAMKGDTSFVFKAARQASRVADLLLMQMRADAAQPEPAIIV